MIFPALTPRRLSLLLALTGAALVLARVDFDRTPGSILDRALEAVLMIGTFGGFLHGAGLQPASRVAQYVVDPRFTWPAILLGGLYLLLR